MYSASWYASLPVKAGIGAGALADAAEGGELDEDAVFGAGVGALAEVDEADELDEGVVLAAGVVGCCCDGAFPAPAGVQSDEDDDAALPASAGDDGFTVDASGGCGELALYSLR